MFKETVEMSAVGELESGRNRTNRLIGLGQILGGFLQAEGHTVIIETQTGVFVDDTVEIITTVIKMML